MVRGVWTRGLEIERLLNESLIKPIAIDVRMLKSPTTDKLKSTDKLKPEHISVFRYAKIVRGCIVASLDRFFTREATIHPLRILVYRKTVMCSGFNLSVDFNLSQRHPHSSEVDLKGF